MKSLSLFLMALAIPVPSSSGSLRSIVNKVWSNFWSTSCSYSTLVSRSKRSVDTLDMRNVDEVFQFLYPSAHVKLEHLIQNTDNSGRSDNLASTGRSFSNWIDHLLDLWESECRSREEKQAREEDGMLDGLNQTISTLPPQNEHGSNVGNSSGLVVSGNKTSRQPGPPGIGDFIPSALPTFFPTLLPTLIPTLPLPTPIPLLTKTEDKFFAAFGGDIEYFIPLIGYGIPFDGEITVLGFHGFKGLFPYK